MAHTPARIVVLGGGSIGLTAARRLRKKLSKTDATITVIDARPYMQYAPFLPETAAGNIDARDVVAPLRKALKKFDVLQGTVEKIDHANKTVTVMPEDNKPYDVQYDHVINGLGSVSRLLPIPGLADEGIGLKNVEEAIAIRNRILNRMDVAASVFDAQERRRMLTFCFIGGGFAGIEAVAEIEDMARYACRAYSTIDPADLNFVVIEGAGRILPEVSEPMGEWALKTLEKRGITFHLNTFLSSCVDGHIVTSTGIEFETDTLVWCAGVKANPVLADASDLPLDRMKRVTALPTLQVAEEDGTVVQGAWSGGDSTAVPDVIQEGKFCPPNAQYAVRQAKVLADNVASEVKGGLNPVQEFSHKNIGVVCSLGLRKGVAEFLGGKIKLKGWLAWMAHRCYHLYAMPTGNRKARILIGWVGQALLGREIVSLGSIEDPRKEFLKSATPVPSDGKPVEQKAVASASEASAPK
ncbi:MAG: FAD-dependent oxidoreductase [Cellulomonadaceae bacterium]|jgi:NADH dehydrogenase|nr:FAD-dependent oxidoreductase [Cellulomonadaceae bacterium]